jgi:hypothetical protein
MPAYQLPSASTAAAWSLNFLYWDRSVQYAWPKSLIALA